VSIVKSAVISAAGLGSRLGMDTPKCLLKINGKTILQTQLDLLDSIEMVYVVIGFKEEDVMREALRFRPDVVFVRNPDFASTSNTYSLSLAAELIDGSFISIDGDVLIRKKSFEDFMFSLQASESVICVRDTLSQDAVFVSLSESGDSAVAFSTSKPSDLEWSGIAFIADIVFDKKTSGFVYKVLENHLPLKIFHLDCYEIDTPEDFDGVSRFIDREND